jgi:hypothetical protein
MKRMNFIHGVLFALFAFLGSVSLSAQTFYSNGQAAAAIVTELTALSQPPTKALPTVSGNMSVTDPAFTSLKVTVLELVMLELKKGVPTGDAIENVFSQLNQMSGVNQGDRASKLVAVKAYVIDLLS